MYIWIYLRVYVSIYMIADRNPQAQGKTVLRSDTKSFKCLCFQVFHLKKTREVGHVTPKYCLQLCI